MKTTNLIAIVIISAIAFSCSKTVDGPAPKSNTELLTQKAWKFEIYGLDENNNGTIEASENAMLSCESDDIFSFHTNGTGVFAGGATKCSPDEPATIDFNWSFANNGTELAVFAAPEKINKLDENILEVYYMDQNSMGQAVKFIRRFQH